MSSFRAGLPCDSHGALRGWVRRRPLSSPREATRDFFWKSYSWWLLKAKSSDLIRHHRTLFPNKNIHFTGPCRRVTGQTYKTIGCLYKTWGWWPLCLVPMCLWATPQLPSDLNNSPCVLSLVSQEILVGSQSHWQQ